MTVHPLPPPAAPRHGWTPNQLAVLCACLVVLLLVVSQPASRDWLSGKFTALVAWVFHLLGADLGPIT